LFCTNMLFCIKSLLLRWVAAYEYVMTLKRKSVFLVAVAKSGKASFSFVMPVRMYKLGTLWTDFREILCRTLLLKCVKLIHIWLKSKKKKYGTLHEDLSACKLLVEM
jgi:hypothetical protein